MSTELTPEQAEQVYYTVRRNFRQAIPDKDDKSQGSINVAQAHYSMINFQFVYYAMAMYWMATAMGKEARWYTYFAQLCLGMDIPQGIDPVAANVQFEYLMLKQTLASKLGVAIS